MTIGTAMDMARDIPILLISISFGETYSMMMITGVGIITNLGITIILGRHIALGKHIDQGRHIARGRRIAAGRLAHGAPEKAADITGDVRYFFL